MKLIITIPAYNEEQTIGQVVSQIPRNITGIDEIKVLVIDDGSTDNTTTAAKQAGADFVISNRQNVGLAQTFQRGLNEALKFDADIIVNTDADNQYNQQEITKLIQPILGQKADIVLGDRQIAKLKFMPSGNKYGNLFGSWVIRKLTGCKINDASTGFRALTREAVLRLNILSKHTYTHEMIIQAFYKNLTLVEIPVEFKPRQAGKSKLINNIFVHIKNSALDIIKVILNHKPLKILFYTGIIIMFPGIILGLRFLYYYLSDQGSGHVQSLILSAILLIVGFLVIVIGLLSDVVSFNRKINEEILYQLKRRHEKK
jgi:glycosyltransferase involved in cell wall biosynthesis